MSRITDLVSLAKTSVDSYDFLRIRNSVTNVEKKIATSTLFPTMVTSGSSSEDVFVSVTNKNQLNFKGIKSGDTGLLTVATTSNNIVLTPLEAGIDLSLCNNTTSEFLTGVDFTGTVTGECAVTNGGTGLDAIVQGAMLYASDANTIAATAAMSTNGQLLIGNTTTGIPTLATLTAGTNVTVTNTAGAISIAASLGTMSANLDMYDGSTYTYNIDLNGGEGWISGSGIDEGITVDADGKVFMGENAPVATFADTLNIKGGIRFTNTDAPTIKPTATENATSGQSVTIEGGGSDAAAAGNLLLTGGTAAGNGAGGDVILTAGRDTSGSADGDIQLKTYAGSAATAGLTVATQADSPAAVDVTVNTGNLVITNALKGIVHTNSGTVTQAINHSTGVTLNSTSGVITLANVALNAAAEADFAVANSSVQQEAVILLTVQSPAAGSATDNASLHAELDEVNDGSFNIRLTNPGAGNTAGVYKIHFLVINNS